MKKTIQEVIVVEGRDDTKRLREVFPDVSTIETRGSAINEEIIEKIALAQEKRGVIVFTDPDFHGEKIRKIISQNVPGVEHAFLPRTEARPEKAGGSLGIEHAKPAAIVQALEHLLTQDEEADEQISQLDLLTAGLIAGADSKRRRELLGEILHIGYTNSKQLYKRLKMFQVTQAEFGAALLQIKQELGD